MLLNINGTRKCNLDLAEKFHITMVKSQKKKEGTDFKMLP